MTGITKEKLTDVPNVIELPEMSVPLIENISDYIVLIPTSTRASKEFPIEISKDIISKLSDKKIVFLGSGQFARDYYAKLSEYAFGF